MDICCMHTPSQVLQTTPRPPMSPTLRALTSSSATTARRTPTTTTPTSCYITRSVPWQPGNPLDDTSYNYTQSSLYMELNCCGPGCIIINMYGMARLYSHDAMYTFCACTQGKHPPLGYSIYGTSDCTHLFHRTRCSSLKTKMRLLRTVASL